MKGFDRSRLEVRSLAERHHDMDLTALLPLGDADTASCARVDQLAPVAGRILAARRAGAAVIMMMGAHVIRSGVQRFIIDLMEKGLVTGLAMNGAGVIHDFELSLIGATTESVARYIRDGRFGLWKETGRINDIINAAYAADPHRGLGSAVGQAIAEGVFPHHRISLLAAGFRLNLPVTVHVGIGYDIIHQLPNCDGAATGALSYNDFLIMADQIQRLEGGVLLCFGSAVMAPEVFLKALSMARNLARQRQRRISDFTTLVCDLYPLPEDIGQEAPKDSAAYYFRPWKTLLVRTVAEGGQGYYVCGRHDQTIPCLWQALQRLQT